eukprot:UN10529
MSSESWRTKQAEPGTTLDFIKRSWIVGSFGFAAYVSYWYIHHKRTDLSLIQKTQFILWPVLYALRQPLQLFYIQKKKNCSAARNNSISIHVICIFNSNIFCKTKTSTKLQWTDYVSIGLTIIGHSLVVISERQRHIFKSNDINKGKLYTKGLNSLTRHPNYLGETILFTALSEFSGQTKMYLLYPIAMLIQFYFGAIPEIEQYLAKRYPHQWPQYEQNVKSLIPFVY